MTRSIDAFVQPVKTPPPGFVPRLRWLAIDPPQPLDEEEEDDDSADEDDEDDEEDENDDTDEARAEEEGWRVGQKL